MTKTQRQVGRAIRNVIRADRAQRTAEATQDWPAYRAAGKINLANANKAVRSGVSWAKILRVGL